MEHMLSGFLFILSQIIWMIQDSSVQPWNHVEYGLYYDNGIRLLRNDRFKVFSDQNERTQANPRAIYQIPVFET